jgi:Acyltransferase family
MTELVTDMEKAKRPRLKFIDMARSIAILMMLEGHFTGSALNDSYRSNHYWIYSLWHNLHGLTSPLFFTVTGVVFVYLLSNSPKDLPFRENERIGKGFKRVGMLLFWGYFIQFDFITFFKSLYYGFRNVFNGDGWVFKFHMDWFQAFHVLQSIGVGIFFLICIFGVYKLINKGPLYLYYLFFALIIFIFYGYMKHHITWDDHLVKMGNITDKTRNYFPEDSPKFVQNMFYGQFSDFSFLRYAGYVLMGGMIGSIIRKYEHNVRFWWFGLTFIALGLLFASFSPFMFKQVDVFTNYIGLTAHGHFNFNGTSFTRIGQVAILLGALMLIDANFNVKAPLFLKMGQTTFPVYIVHVIILYGGILGLGLDPSDWYHHQFHPWIAAGVSVVFITAFVFMVKYIEPLTRLYYRVFKVFYPSKFK